MHAHFNNRNSGLHSRPARIGVAVGVAAGLGLADLWLTVSVMRTTGMYEMNPLARILVGMGPAVLVAFKIGSLLLNAGLLLACRRRFAAELGAWVSVAVMVALIAHWSNYMHSMRELGMVDQSIMAADPTFVKISG